MRPLEIAMRLLIQFGIFAVICAVFIASSTSSDAGMILVYPFFLGIPGAIVALAVFAPIEAAGLRRKVRWVSLILIPLVGAILPWLLFYPVAGNWNNFIHGAMQLSEIGALWGGLWITTRFIYAACSAISRLHLPS